MARDYGNGNRTFDDERTDDYLVNDLNIDYNLSENNKLYFNIINLFDENMKQQEIIRKCPEHLTLVYEIIFSIYLSQI